jgi:hypothetical protein
MKNILLIILIVLLSSGCASTIGYVDAKYEAGVVLNVGGDSEFYEVEHFNDDVVVGDLVVIKRKTLSLYNEDVIFKPNRIRTLR